MRSIFHEILARYLGTEQHAFEATSRELWPVDGYVPLFSEKPDARTARQDSDTRSFGELEPQECL
jgi:hypothetical protein